MKKNIIIVLCLILISAFLIVLFTFKKDKKEDLNQNQDEPKQVEVVETPKLKIIDLDSTSRTIAVQINNHNQARLNHAGLNDAYIVYEFIVEGGITRMLALFKDKTTEKIGSVRSARPYFLDYVLENDAIYVHFGFSDLAKKEISSLGINNINGLYDDAFWRDRSLNVDYEHTAYTSMEKINNMIDKKGYRKTSSKKTLLNYSIEEINIEGNLANKVVIPYSYYMTVKYEYDTENKVYKRFANDVAHTDSVTKKQYTFKNIIIAFVENYTTNEGGGRQALNNIGEGTGYFITNGTYKEIKWKKDTRDSQTVYMYSDDSEIKVNDGNTFIQVVPINSNVSFE